MDTGRLCYRRQFILSRNIVPRLSKWNCLPVANGFHLYSHPDLPVTRKEHNGTILVLLGYIFDSIHYTKKNEQILEDIVTNSATFDSFIESTKGYAGQFVIFYMREKVFRVVHDALALREVYYCAPANKIVCGSQPNTIKEYSDPPVGITTDESILEFYENDLKKNRRGRTWVGDGTYYDGVKHLLPNHYLDITELAARRYWPKQVLPKVELEDAVRRSSCFLEGILKAATSRYEVMMAVTGGTDSRTLLAASRELKDKIYYFINKHKHLDDGHPDIYIPKALFKRINLPFHIHDIQEDVDETFKRIFLSNTFLSTELLLPVIYNIYYKKFSQKLNICGVGEVGRTRLGDEPRKIDGYYLARALKFKNSPYAVDQCQKWLDITLPVSHMFKVNIMTLLYWEQVLGNWGAVGNSESDIAIEEFNPYDSHYLFETFLGVDKKYVKYGENVLFKEMIRYMWPELIEFPTNPLHKKTDRIRLVLKKTGMLKPLKSLAYKMDWMKFRFVCGRRSQRKRKLNDSPY